MRVLQVGLGGFGRNHLRAWSDMGRLDTLWVAELSADLHVYARRAGIPAERIGTAMEPWLDQVEVVDIVTPSDSHFELCRKALERGKHVFVEKPMTMSSAQATELATLAAKRGRCMQVGFYYRYHPIARWLRGQLREGCLGAPRYAAGNFMGFKRARTDVGVVHTDGIHFIDLFNWLLGEAPVSVYATVRDHFGRGMEDLGLVIMEYASGAVARVEAGYVQPGRWRDKVVPNALTTKDLYVCGATATAEVDFETEQASLHRVAHAFNGTTWAPQFGGSEIVHAGTATPVQMIAAELEDFLARAAAGRTSAVGPVDAGVVPARVIEAVYASAKAGAPVRLTWTEAEQQCFAGAES